MEGTQIKDLRQSMKNLTLTFIVLEIGVAVPVKENREVRTVKVADASACINLSLWGEAGNVISPGDIIRITKGYVSVWRNCLTLYTGKGGDLDKVGNFCMVFNEQLNMSDPKLNVNDGEAGPAPINNGSNGKPRTGMLVGKNQPPRFGAPQQLNKPSASSKAAPKAPRAGTGLAALRNLHRSDRR